MRDRPSGCWPLIIMVLASWALVTVLARGCVALVELLAKAVS